MEPRLLFDENLSKALPAMLADVFPGSSHVLDEGLVRRPDREVFEQARAHGFTIVTLDKDFEQLVFLLGSPPKVILLRCGNRPSVYIEALIRSFREEIRAFIADARLDYLKLG